MFKLDAASVRDETLRLVSNLVIFRSLTSLVIRGLDPLLRFTLSHQYSTRPRRVQEDKYFMVRGMLYSLLRARPPQRTIDLILDVFINTKGKRIKKEFFRVHGFEPPSFLVISPFKGCNLRCPSCYADSAIQRDKLSYQVVSRIVREAEELWGDRFFVLSGGEPLMYRDEGKGVLDLVAEHPASLFLMYTNGTLITEEVAARMAELSNITPAISVEGLKERTELRRGKGSFERILEGMENLRSRRVPFGLSITATRENAEELMDDEFLDFFLKRGATYGWIFHYMPIGRDVSFDLMPAPEQRRKLWEWSWQVVKERRVMLADFWNHGTVSNGCISAGRAGGYLYIDWTGNVAPCVFFPYSPVNINEIYKNNGDLNQLIDVPFFRAIREWQDRYGYDINKRLTREQDWLRPCPIRDHYEEARRLIDLYKPVPIDPAAQEALKTPEYRKRMVEFDESLKKTVQRIWEHEYIEPG